MDTIGNYVTQLKCMGQEPDNSRGYFIQRAVRHQQEAERLLRIGDTRQAEMHANIARKHADRAKEIDADMQVPAECARNCANCKGPDA